MKKVVVVCFPFIGNILRNSCLTVCSWKVDVFLIFMAGSKVNSSLRHHPFMRSPDAPAWLVEAKSLLIPQNLQGFYFGSGSRGEEGGNLEVGEEHGFGFGFGRF